MSARASQDSVLDTLRNAALGNRGERELVFNPRTGTFEVMSPNQVARNPDVAVTPYDEEGFF